MNVLILKNKTQVTVEQVDGDVSAAMTIASKYLKEGFTAEFYLKHSDLKFGGVLIEKTQEQIDRELKEQELKDLKNPK